MHLGIPRKSDLKPKGKQRSILPFPATFSANFHRYKNGKSLISLLVIVFIVNYIFKFFTSSSNAASDISFKHLTNQKALETVQKNHGIYKNEIPVSSVYIFPPIEHAPLLRELTLDKLFKFKVNSDLSNQKMYYYADDDTLNESNELKDNEESSKNPLDMAKKAFKENGQKVFRPSTFGSSPEIVIVTGVDFETFELSHLTKIVQNRVNYAHSNKYGVYVRWIQEFLPSLQEFGNDSEWARLFIMRAAMHAFPNAKYFWYVDQNALILRNDIDLDSYILKPSSLGPIMLRDQPILLPYGAIKTYKSVKPEDVSFIITQTAESLNADSFILKNDVYGRGLLEFWSDPLFRKYPTFNNNLEAALTHILQWHPVLLSKSSIVPSRTICSTHDANGLVLPGQESIRYHDRDFVVDFKGCGKEFHCESLVDSFYKKIEAA